jgi:hypothetical protein
MLWLGDWFEEKFNDFWMEEIVELIKSSGVLASHTGSGRAETGALH